MIQPSYTQLAIGYVMYTASAYFYDILTVVLKFFGIHRYTIYGDNERYRHIVKRLEATTMNTSFIYRKTKVVKSGYFASSKCIGSYLKDSTNIEDEKVILLTTPAYFNELTAEEETEVKEIVKEEVKVVRSNKIRVFMRNGSYRSLWYTPITLDMTNLSPVPAQAPVVADILRIFAAKGRATVFIHGVTGAGKSSVGYLVAKALRANYCNTFRPTDPGDTFGNMLGELRAREDDDKPIVIAIEEANKMIHAVHEEKIIRHRETPVPIIDKTSWVGFLDNMIFYRNIILILTSNESKADLDALDPAYLNSWRINAVYSMMEPLKLE